MTSAIRFAILMGTFVSAVGLSFEAGAKEGAVPASSAVSRTKMSMVAPLFLVNGEFSSTLYMVNGLTILASAKVTLFDLNGTMITDNDVEFDPDTERHLEIGKLLEEAGSPVAVGSLRVEPMTEHGMGVLAQVAITHHGPKDSYFDEELAVPSSMGSQMLRSVADAGGAGVVVSITNLSSGSNQSVTVTGIGEKGPIIKLVRLAGNQTKMGRPCTAEVQDHFDGSVQGDFANLSKASSGMPCGISITTDFLLQTLAPDRRKIAEADKVVTRFEWTGTHRGEFLGVPATGRSVKVWGVVIDRLQNGRIKETRIIMDRLGLMMQLGAFPPPRA